MQSLAAVVQLDPLDDLLWRDQIHAARNPQIGADLDWIQANIMVVLRIPVPDRLAARLPAAAVSATGEGADRAHELMSGVGLPMRRFAAAAGVPGLETVEEIYDVADEDGHGDLDYAATLTLLEKWAGVEVKGASA